MCRLMAYVGQPQLLADIVLWPDRSIIKQSYDARERKIDPTLPFHLGHGNLNGDGFGIGWFNPEERREHDPTPCVFTSITPAWNNENLSRLACKIVSPLVFAHVRAAYPGMPVSEQNCHPFSYSRYMWMHNGVVAGFAQIRRALLETLSDTAYNAVASFHSDSAVSFALFLHHLPCLKTPQPPDVLIRAMQATIATISAVQRRHGITSTSLLNYVLSDGNTLIATRFVSPSDDSPASLYYAEGASFARSSSIHDHAHSHILQAHQRSGVATGAGAAAGGGEAAAKGCGGCPGAGPAQQGGSSITQESSYELGVSVLGPRVVFVASEPITASGSDWVAVPKNTALVVTREKGGFLNIMRCPLLATPLPAIASTPSPPPPVPPPPSSTIPAPIAAAAGGSRPSGGGAPAASNPPSTAVSALVPSTVTSRSSGGLPTTVTTTNHGHGQVVVVALNPGVGVGGLHVDPQRDVCLCLEALSRGRTAKSRAYTARRPTGGLMGLVGAAGLGGGATSSIVSLPGGGDSMLERGPSGPMTNSLRPGSYSGGGGLLEGGTSGAMGAGGTGQLPQEASRAGSAGLEGPLAGADSGSGDSHEFMRLVGHSAPVVVMLTCPHTRRLYTSSIDCSVKVWSLADNSCIASLVGPKKPVIAMKLRAQGRLLLAASGRKIRVWDTQHFKLLKVVKLHDSCGVIRCIEVLGGIRDADAITHPDAQRPQAQQPPSRKQSLAGDSADGGGSVRSSATGDGSDDVTLWRRRYSLEATGGAVALPSEHNYAVSLAEGLGVLASVGSPDAGPAAARVAALLERNSAHAAAGASNGPSPLPSPHTNANGGTSAHSQPNRGLTLLYVGCQDSTVKVFSLDEQHLLAVAAGEALPDQPSSAAAAISVPPSPGPAAAAAARTFPGGAPPSPRQSASSVAATPTSPFFRPPAATSPAAAPPRLHRVVTAPDEADHALTDLTPVAVTPADGGHVGPVNALTLCGRYLCTAGGDATVRVWDAVSLRLVGVLRGHRGSVLCVLGLGGGLLLSGARDNTIRVWDLEMDMMCRRTLTGHKDDVTGLSAVTLHTRVPGPCATHPQASTAAGAPGAQTLAQRPSNGSVSNGLQHATSGGGAGAGGGADGGGAVTPGGRSVAMASTVVASSSADGTVRLWSTSWAPLCILTLPASAAAGPGRPLTPPGVPLVPAAFCAALTTELAAAGYGDGEVRMWHIEDVHAAVVQRCCAEMLAAEAALEAACGCVVHGVQAAAVGQALEVASSAIGGRGGSVQDALALLTACAAAETLAAEADGSCVGGAGAGGRAAQAAAGVSTNVNGGVHTPSNTPAEVMRAASAVDGAADTEVQRQGHKDDGTNSGEGRKGMQASPSLAHLAAGGGSGTDHDGADQAGAADQQQGDQQQEQQPATMSDAAATLVRAAYACARGRSPRASLDGQPIANGQKGTSSGGALVDPFAMAAAAALPCGAVSPAAAVSTSVVPVHVHGQRSPLAGPPGVLGNLAAAAALTATAPPSVQLPLPRGLGALGLGSWCSTSDQQLEAALREFVRIQTVSVSPRHRDDCLKGARFLAKMLEGLGADVKVVQVYEDKNPVVLGRLGYNPDRPTVTFYGHYDVQPAAEPDWATNPFELNSVNEYLYGRGVSDNKGPILAFIWAVRELMNACGGGTAADGCVDGGGAGGGGCNKGRLPVNVAFVFEGEEENGSRGFTQAVQQNPRFFEGTELIIISNTLWVGENVPCLTYGMRGMLSLTLQITGPERDLHSGNDGGVFSEPMVDLLRVMATLVGPGGRVQVPGFYDDVEPGLIDLAWCSLQHSEEFSLEGYQAALGVPSLTAPPDKRSLLVTRWCTPSLSVVDMRPGGGSGAADASAATCYRFGPTRFSVIPKAAQGKMSVRFVPNQDADKLVACLRKHLHDAFRSLGSSNSIELQVEARGNWWEKRRGSPWLARAEAAVFKEWGVHPLYVREGGTMPVASHLEAMLAAPAIMVPMGQSSDNCHLANERIRRTNLFRGKNVIRRLLEEVAALGVQRGGGQQGLGAGEAARGGGIVDQGTPWGQPTAHAGLAE